MNTLPSCSLQQKRFGVKHKEKISNLKQSVDVLTLTATPIPRTLYMAVNGFRDVRWSGYFLHLSHKFKPLPCFASFFSSKNACFPSVLQLYISFKLTFSPHPPSSLIKTPPPERIPIKSTISVHDSSLVKQAIDLEIQRGGQVFYVLPRVSGGFGGQPFFLSCLELFWFSFHFHFLM